jgi:hypothetical protein
VWTDRFRSQVTDFVMSSGRQAAAAHDDDTPTGAVKGLHMAITGGGQHLLFNQAPLVY